MFFISKDIFVFKICNLNDITYAEDTVLIARKERRLKEGSEVNP